MAHTTCRAVGAFHHLPVHRRPVHGPVSEYEPLNIPEKAHYKFVPAEECTVDDIPLMAAPAPTVKEKHDLAPDPKLSVTPNKMDKHIHSKTDKLTPDPTLNVTPDKPGKSAPMTVPRPDPSLCATPEQTLTAVSRIKHAGARPINEGLPVGDPDPLLTATPEHLTTVSYVNKSNLRSDKNDTEVRAKVKQKVRFDIQQSNSDASLMDTDVLYNLNTGPEKNIGSKAYQPRLYTEDCKVTEDFFKDEQPRTVQYTVTRHSDHGDTLARVTDTTNSQQKFTSSSSRRERPLKAKSATKHEGLPRTEDPIGMMSKCDKTANFVVPRTDASVRRKVVVTREFQERPVITEYQYPFRDDGGDRQLEHVFSRPEYNNSLKVCSEIKEIAGMVPDVDTALKKHLDESEEKRTEICEKAASKVNQMFCASQYSGLVGVETPMNNLCLKTEQEMSRKSKIAKPPARKPSHRKEPDLMEFFTPDLQKEAPDFRLKGIPMPDVGLSTAEPNLAFDLYRHNRVWEGLP